ncbi:MAG TPA: tetratricopeptide repeat protein [Thermoanaerobaculia bacterium]|nr:tetratricopeptide repeat protein [Thermoanaerobaculia bacterium]
MTDFFISYTQADRPWAEWIAWVLEEAGYRTKIQAWDFRPGTNFVMEMDNAAKDAERTLLVLSPDYLKSGFGKAEWSAAFARDPTGEKGLLLPVRIQELNLEGLLGQIVYVDLVGADEAAAREKLLTGLARGRSKPSKPSVFPGTSPAPPPQFPGDLAAFPEDEIPDPGPLPAGSRMPLSRNRLFVGRQEDLLALARQLKVGTTSAVGEVETAAATGLGGIGKTQLASELVHRYGRFFAGGVFWMSFADLAAVPAEVAACGRSLGLHPDYDRLPLENQVRLVEEVWQSPLPRLLVFDNCEEEDLLSRWRPRFGGTRVLVTSRRSRWDRGLDVQAVALKTLPRPSSIELLRRFRPDVPSEEAALNGIADELGDLPLALHLAGSFLERYRDSPFGQPAAYLGSLLQSGLLDHSSLQGKGSKISPTGHEAHVARTFALSFERLNPEEEIDALAIALLARAAYFASGEPIPRDLLLKTVDKEFENDDAGLQTHDALERLIDFGLLDTGKAGSLVLHRLVARFARNAEAVEPARSAVEEALLAEADRLNAAGFPASLLLWQVHLRAVTKETENREDPTSASLCSQLGFHLLKIGDLLGGRPYCERALEIREKVLGLEHPDTARSLNNLGFLLQNQGDFAGARSYYERALAIREKVLGPEHPNTARSLNNLGTLIKDQGDLTGARPFLERALAIWERVLGPEHPDTARSLNNLGALLQDQGDLVGARPYFERALAIRETALGPEHPDTGLGLNNLGVLLQKQGDLAGAQPYYERALKILEKALDRNHPWTIRARKNLQSLNRI